MSSELRLYDPLERLSLKKLNTLVGHMQSLLEALSDDATDGDGWLTTDLQIGSLGLALAPVRERDADVPTTVVNGIVAMRESGELPTYWSQRAARAALRLLNASTTGTTITARRDELTVNLVVDEPTRNAVAEVLKGRYTSFGSVTGHLRNLADTQNPHATLVLPGGHEVRIVFGPEHDIAVRGAWRRHRVEVRGRIVEQADGTPVRVEMTALDVLPETSGLRDTDVQGGFYPDVTGDLTADAYLARLRGTA